MKPFPMAPPHHPAQPHKAGGEESQGGGFRDRGRGNFEVPDIAGVPPLADLSCNDLPSQPLTQALKALREQEGLDFAMLMVTDVVNSSSRLLLTDEPPQLSDLPYPPQPDGTRLAEGVVSRKKQLLPVVLGLLER